MDGGRCRTGEGRKANGKQGTKRDTNDFLEKGPLRKGDQQGGKEEETPRPESSVAAPAARGRGGAVRGAERHPRPRTAHPAVCLPLLMFTHVVLPRTACRPSIQSGHWRAGGPGRRPPSGGRRGSDPRPPRPSAPSTAVRGARAACGSELKGTSTRSGLSAALLVTHCPPEPSTGGTRPGKHSRHQPRVSTARSKQGWEG